MKIRLLALTALLWVALRGEAYIDTCPSLGAALSTATSIVVLRVDKVNLEKRAILYRKVADLKGVHPTEEIKHQITDGGHPRDPKTILQWARPGRTAIGLLNGKIFLTCLGDVWYESAAQEPPWWTLSRVSPEMSYSYAGSVEKLRRHVVDILAGKEVVVTAVSYAGNATGASFSTAIHYKSSQRGVPLCRLRASLKLTSYRPEQLVGRNGGTEEDVPEWLKALDDPDGAKRADAAEELGRIGPPAKAAVPALLKALKDVDPRARLAAAGALASIDAKNPAVLPVLLEELKGGADQRRAAAEILGEQGSAAVPALRDVLKDADAGVRWAAAESLGRMGPSAKAAVPALAAALEDPEIRGIAADALGGIGAEARPAVPGLVRIVQNEKDRSLRYTAGVALARVDAAAAGVAAPLFAEALKDPDGRNRHDAIVLLKQVGPSGKEATPLLTEMLRDKTQYVRYLAAQAFVAIKDPRAVPALLETLEKDVDAGVRAMCVQALSALGPDAKAAVPALEARLKDVDAGTRIVSAEALWKINKDVDKAVPVLMEGLKGKPGYMVGLAAGILGRMGPDARSAVPELLAMLKSDNESHRRVAASLLKSIDPKAR